MSEPASVTPGIPGPWFPAVETVYAKTGVVRGGYEDIVQVCECAHDDAATATLIAAAPALYEALAEMVAATEGWNEAVQDIIGRQPRTGIDLEHARAALASARGEKS